MPLTNPARRALTFCRHDVPCGSYCRWCKEGGEPEAPVRLTADEHAARVVEIRAGRIATSPKPRLTREQRAKVRSLMVDEGESRASAVAWVLAFEPAVQS